MRESKSRPTREAWDLCRKATDCPSFLRVKSLCYQMPHLFRGGRRIRHGRRLRQNDLPIPILLGEDSKEPIFSAKWNALIFAIDGHMFRQDSHVPIGVKLNVRFARVEHFERAVGPL